MKVINKKIVIAGSGISGQGALKLAEKIGYKTNIYIDENSLCDAETVIVSPGFPLNHEVFAFCVQKGLPIIGEIEFGYRFCKKPIIAVTGTNGKTTTVKLLAEIFRADGIKVSECGNIGKSFCAVVADEVFDVAILELSSFQLQTIVDFHPHIGVILNIGEDHLDRHVTRQNYAMAKLNIAKNMDLNDILILDSGIECGLLNTFSPGCKVIFSNLKAEIGIYIEDGMIFFGNHKVCCADKIKMRGEHNLHNILSAVAAAKSYGISDKAISEVIERFEPPAHRIQYVDTIAGVKFYNDSKGTNIDATLAAIKTFSDSVCLLLGGSDKGEDFRRLFNCMGSNVKAVIAMGEIKEKILIAAQLMGYKNIKLCNGMEEAVKLSLLSGCNTVLLSPAAASFDKYSGFEERGNHFVSLIKGIKK